MVHAQRKKSERPKLWCFYTLCVCVHVSVCDLCPRAGLITLAVFCGTMPALTRHTHRKTLRLWRTQTQHLLFLQLLITSRSLRESVPHQRGYRHTLNQHTSTHTVCVQVIIWHIRSLVIINPMPRSSEMGHLGGFWQESIMSVYKQNEVHERKPNLLL